MSNNIENINSEDLREMYDSFFKYELNAVGIKEDQKKIIDSMKKRIADLENLVNKKNEVDPKKVKAGLLKKALITYLEKVNKIEKDLGIMESYLIHFNNKEIPVEQSRKYGELSKLLKEGAADHKKEKKEYLDVMDESIILAVSYIANKAAIEKLLPGSKDDQANKNALKENEPELIKKHIELVKSLEKILKK